MADGTGLGGPGDGHPPVTEETLQHVLESAVDIRDFLDARKAQQLSFGQCSLIVDEAIRVLEGLYVHLPLKRAMYAVDPIRRLRLLQFRLQRFCALEALPADAAAEMPGEPALPPDDLWFHREMSDTFTSVRDLHTSYVLPDPFGRAVAILPFQIEDFFEDDGPTRRQRKFIVGNVIDGLDWFKAPDGFMRGVEVTHWNGIPIRRAVEIAGERNAGSNPDARLARGLARLTIRPLAKSLPPDEEWVAIDYTCGVSGESQRVQARWHIAQFPAGQEAPPDGSMLEQAMGEGLDHEADLIRLLRGEMFGPKHRATRRSWALRPGRHRPARAPNETARLQPVDGLPEFFQAKTFSSGGVEYGYIRIRSFKAPLDDAVLNGFAGLLQTMPPDGLVIDVRDNPGGYILTGERLLQTLTPKIITPEPLQFINTPLSLEFCKMFPGFERWADSIERALQTKTTFSSSIPLSPPDQCNSIGQRYYGPVVLITNGLCYSTTDIFAAGFQDHGIGPVLGTDGSTGAGGANVMTCSQLRAKYDDVKAAADRDGAETPAWPLGREPLPLNADIRIAIRRSLRVGERSGTELEDLGVIPNIRYWMTRNDILSDNMDLLEKAAELLRGMDSYALEETGITSRRRGADEVVTASITTRGIEWLDVFIDGWASRSQRTNDGPNRIIARRPHGRPSQILELCGYRMKEGEPALVARRKIKLGAYAQPQTTSASPAS